MPGATKRRGVGANLTQAAAGTRCDCSSNFFGCSQHLVFGSNAVALIFVLDQVENPQRTNFLAPFDSSAAIMASHVEES